LARGGGQAEGVTRGYFIAAKTKRLQLAKASAVTAAYKPCLFLA